MPRRARWTYTALPFKMGGKRILNVASQPRLTRILGKFGTVNIGVMGEDVKVIRRKK